MHLVEKRDMGSIQGFLREGLEEYANCQYVADAVLEFSINVFDVVNVEWGKAIDECCGNFAT